MRHVRVAPMVPQDCVDAVSDALEALDALSVGIEDADAQTDAEQALFGEPGMPAPRRAGSVRAYAPCLRRSPRPARRPACCHCKTSLTGVQCWVSQAVPEQDWVRLTQSQFAPVEITPAFWVVPSWHAPPAQAKQVIRLDPGLAFGTGTHPTTRMCLRWIARNPVPQARAGLRLRLGYSGDRCGQDGRAHCGCSGHRRCRGAVHAPQRRGQRRWTCRRVAHRSRTGCIGLVLANILATP